MIMNCKWRAHLYNGNLYDISFSDERYVSWTIVTMQSTKHLFCSLFVETRENTNYLFKNLVL